MPADVIPFPTKHFIADAKLRALGHPSPRRKKAAPAPDAVPATCEMTPPIFPHAPYDVQRVCRDELGCPEIRLVPVHPIEDAHPTNYVENIARRMLTEQGRPLFGYRLRKSALFVVAEFYAVFMDGTRLIDVTPNTRGDSFVAFAPDYDIPPDFDYLERPVIKRFSTYTPPSRMQLVAAEIAAMEPRRLASERRRATEVGLTLEDKLSLVLVPDMLERCLDLYLEALEEMEKSTIVETGGRGSVDPKHLEFLHRRKSTLEALVHDAFADRRVPHATKKRRR